MYIEKNKGTVKIWMLTSDFKKCKANRKESDWNDFKKVTNANYKNNIKCHVYCTYPGQNL
jgi:hypothetical protein